MLVRAQDVTHARVVGELAQQEIGLVHTAPGGKGPVGADAFAGHAFRLDDARVGVTAWRHQAPQPRQRRRKDMEEAEDAVARGFPGAWGRPNAETADIDRNGPIHDAGEHFAGDDDAGIGERTPGASSMCSRIRPRLSGTASIFRNSSGMGGSAVKRSRCTSVP